MIDHDRDLQHAHTLRCPSQAQFWTTLKQTEQLPEIQAWWHQQGCELQMLGQGSNTLCPQRVPGLTVGNELQGYWVEDEDTRRLRVRVASGMDWHQWVLFCAEQGWYGLENLALIPGTIGGAPVQNIGAYGIEVASCIASVRAFNWRTAEWVNFAAKDCQFAYRQSIFKESRAAGWFITDVVFELSKHFKPNLTYASLASLNSDHMTAQLLIAEVCRIREQKLPNPNQVPNAGSFFTNPVVPRQQAELLKKQVPLLPMYPMAKQHIKLSAAYLIDQAGWRGWQDPYTGVGTWQHHALVIVNPNHQSLANVLEVVQRIQDDIFQRYQIKLEIEPQRINSQPVKP